jgi:hypothetical protein
MTDELLRLTVAAEAFDTLLRDKTTPALYDLLPLCQHDPRRQRMLQDEIESRRRLTNGAIEVRVGVPSNL